MEINLLTSFGHYDRNRKFSPEQNSPNLFPSDSKPYNLSYKEWTSKWWQWVISIPKGKNPLCDHTGKNCAEGQYGPVWFLAGTSDKTHKPERRCVIPTGKAILFPIIVSQFSYSEVPFIKTDAELISYTAKDINRWSLLEVTIDGVKLPNLSEYRIQIGPFDLLIPEGNIWDIRPGPTRAVSDGFWVFLEPLSDGNYIVSLHGREPNFETRVTYYISILP